MGNELLNAPSLPDVSHFMMRCQEEQVEVNSNHTKNSQIL
jgi:hypothetical protein